MIELEELEEFRHDLIDIRPGLNTIRITDKSSLAGTPKSQELFSSNGTILEKVEWNYDVSGDWSNNQGKIEEITHEDRIIDVGNLIHNDNREMDVTMGNVTILSRIPSVLRSITSTNYKTGITSETINLSFDFYSGEVTETLSSDGYGNQYVSKSVPAYRMMNENLDKKYRHTKIHVIVNNLSIHKHKDVKQWLSKKRKLKLHFTPTYSS
ncbi:MAG: hypothetical protein GY816_04655 [Cytophagales bacterium]|nr:hypothetical protein [Cytophagales bacterium]